MSLDQESFSAPEFLRNYAPYDRMRDEHLAFLAAQLKPIRFQDGETVTDPAAGPAEWFYILASGIIVGTDPGESDEGEFELQPGECFPIGALVANRRVQQKQKAQGDVVCLTMDRSAFNDLTEMSTVFNDYCSSRLSGLLVKVNRQAQAKAARDLGEDSSLNVPLSEKRLRTPKTVTRDTSIRTVLEKMSEFKIGSMVVSEGDGPPVGIFTLKDLMNRVVLTGKSIDDPIETAMTPDPITLPKSAFAFEAAMAMANAGIQHLVVVDGVQPVGVISERDLFSMQRVGLVNLSKSVSRAADVGELARIAADVHVLVAQMIAQGVKVGQITQIITLLNDQIAVRAIELALESADDVSDIGFTWIAFGSEGRQEQTLKTDQDNGILFEAPTGASVEETRTRLMAFASEVNHTLDECGFPLCTGGIMAMNADCCLTGEEWQNRFTRWIDQGSPEHLLKSSIYFDFRGIRGDEAPLAKLRDWLLEKTAKNSRFLKQMAANALQNTPPLGFFRDFRLSGEGAESNTLDLKLNGVTPFIDAARIVSLRYGISATNTVDRLRGAVEKELIDSNVVDAWIDAYNYIRLLRMRINQEQAARGSELSNRVAPNELNDLDRRILKEAFRESKAVQAKIALDYQL